MKWLKLELPDKLFGLDTSIIMMFVPTFGILLLAILSFGWVINPRITDYNKLMSKVKLTEAKTKDLNQKINYLGTIDLSKLSKDEELINNALLPQNNAYLLVNIVRKISQNHGFDVDSFSVTLKDLKDDEAAAQKAKDDGFAGVPVKVVLVGSTDNYIDLISEIENSLPLMSLNQFSVKTAGNMAELDLTISAYYSAEKTAVDINKLTLSDLTLKKDEGDLVAKIGKFKTMENMQLVGGQLKLDGQFVPYTRGNPFSL